MQPWLWHDHRDRWMSEERGTVMSELSAERTRLAQLWEEHMRHEFQTCSTEDTLGTMVEDAYVNHVPVTEHRRQAEGKAAELATKLGFTSAAVVEFFKVLGEQSVPEEKVPARLIE